MADSVRKKIIIMGAAGRDFHNFNVVYRGNPDYEVVAFTATQIPNIEGRTYPASLAGSLYPNGIPIYPEEEITSLIHEMNIDLVVFSYSDVTHDHVMQQVAKVNAAGADFTMLGAEDTMIKSTKPVIAVCAVRTGCGKSQTTRRISDILKGMGKKVAVVRHPMPYGDLVKQAVQRFATLDDLEKHECTIEEIEEYEPHINNGTIVYAGVDYEKILRSAEKEADVVLWDGGNNDTPFYKPDLWVTVMDPHRPGHSTTYYPGQVNAIRADVIVINKEDSATKEQIALVKKEIAEFNKQNGESIVIDANSEIKVADPDLIRGKKVLVVEDGPTLTHGEMKYGAGVVAAERLGCELVDPRKYAVGEIKETFKKYPEIGELLPAMGYGKLQVLHLQETINAVPCDAVVIGTPIALQRYVDINKPATRVTYDLKELSKPDLADILGEMFNK
jgi:predicted GTPase